MKGRITLTMIKPYAVKENHVGEILSYIEKAGFHIKAMKMVKMTAEQAEIFYKEHNGKPFYNELVAFMSSGPIVAVLLEKDNAVEDFRKLIGATDPKEAAEGTIRRIFAKDKTRNAIHGSDSDENAIRESNFFFSAMEKFK